MSDEDAYMPVPSTSQQRKTPKRDRKTKDADVIRESDIVAIEKVSDYVKMALVIIMKHYVHFISYKQQ